VWFDDPVVLCYECFLKDPLQAIACEKVLETELNFFEDLLLEIDAIADTVIDVFEVSRLKDRLGFPTSVIEKALTVDRLRRALESPEKGLDQCMGYKADLERDARQLAERFDLEVVVLEIELRVLLVKVLPLAALER
jgi:hypothetical protein